SKRWPLEEDRAGQMMLRRKVQEKVPDQYTPVKAGSLIISQGEKVTAKHIAELQAMKNAMGEKRNLSNPFTILGSIVLALLLAGICVAYFRGMYPQVLVSNRKLFLLFTIALLTLFFGKMTELFLLSSKNNLIDIVRYPLFAPFAAILLCSLLNTGIATFAS